MLTPWFHEQDEEADASNLLYATKTPKPTRKELRRSLSWAGFATWRQRAWHAQFLEQYPYPRTKVGATDADIENISTVSTWDRRISSASTNMSDAIYSRTASQSSHDAFVEQPKSSHIANQPEPTGRDTATTLAIRNLPYNVTHDELLLAVDASGFAGLYDFVYLPHKFREHRNLGFAFINFETPEVAKHFHELWHLSRRFTVKGTCKGIKALNVSVAAVQGRDANVLQASSHKIDRVKNTSYRPFTSAGFTGLTN